MIDGLIHQAQDAASRTAQTAALGLGAGLCLFVGAGFLTSAGWILLNEITTALNAALILGGIYTGFGLIALATISIRNRAHRNKRIQRAQASAHQPPLAQVVAAFMSGMNAGQKARS